MAHFPLMPLLRRQLPALFQQEGGLGLARAPARMHWRKASVELLTQNMGDGWEGSAVLVAAAEVLC